MLDLALLQNSSDEFIKIKNAYSFWKHLFDKLLSSEEDRVNPNIQSLIQNLKLITLVGFLESLGTGDNYKEKFTQILYLLNPEEKLFFILSFEIKEPNKDRDKLMEEYLNSGSAELLDQLMLEHSKQDKNDWDYVESVLYAYLANDYAQLDQLFKKRVDLLYGIRSIIVHTGLPVVGSSVMDNRVINFHGSKSDKFFTFEPSIEDFFIRCIYKKAGQSTKPINEDLAVFLLDEYLNRHGNKVMLIVSKLKQI